MTHPEEFTDTDPRAMEVWLELMRQMTPGERFTATFKASEFLLRTWESEVRTAHPEADETEVRMRVAARHLPREMMIRAYGWDPALHSTPTPSGNAFDDLPFGGGRVDMAYVRQWAAQCGITARFEQLLDGTCPFA